MILNACDKLIPWNKLLAMLVKHWETGLPHFRALAFPQSKWDCHNGWNISFATLFGGQFTLSTQLIKPNYPVVLSHWRSTTVSSETYPLHPTSPLGEKLHYGGVPPIWLSLPSPPHPTQHYHQRVPFPQQKETLTRLNFLAFKQAWITINPARHAFLWLQECLRQVRERFAEGLALSVLDLSLARPQGEMLIMLKGS